MAVAAAKLEAIFDFFKYEVKFIQLLSLIHHSLDECFNQEQNNLIQ